PRRRESRLGPRPPTKAFGGRLLGDDSALMRQALGRFLDGDIFHSFKQSPATMTAAALTAICILAAALAPRVAQHNPFGLKPLNLLDAFTPPAWSGKGNPTYFLGTDDQGRDVLSAIMFGARMSLVVGLLATLLAMVVGVSLGLLSGYLGGKIDAF